MASSKTSYRIGEIEKAIRRRWLQGRDARAVMVEVMCAFPDLTVGEYLAIQRAVLNNRSFRGPVKKARQA